MTTKQKAVDLVNETWAKGVSITRPQYEWLCDQSIEGTSIEKAMIAAGLLDSYKKAGSPSWGAFREWWKTVNTEKGGAA